MLSAELLTVTPDPALGLGTVSTLARFLEGQGLAVRGCRLVVQDEAEAERALREATSAGGVVACLGEGEGPKIVRHALARLAGTRLVLSDRALEALATAYTRRERAMPRRAEGLALIPQGASVLVAAEGGEPGLLAEVAGALVVVLPDDPSLAIALLREHVLPRVPRRGVEPVVLARTLRLVGLTLAEVDARLSEALRPSEGVSARSAEVDGEVWTRLRLRGPTAVAAEGVWRLLEPTLRTALGTAWYGSDEETLEAVVGRLLKDRGWTLAVAESCTGGLVGHRLTEVSGASAYFERGFVVYSNAAKRTLLGVPEAVLARHGAVSAQCAEAMAHGARRQAGTTLGVSVTGIAGPEGGTPTKPVGLTFIGLADAQRARVHRYGFDRGRRGNKTCATLMALDLIRRYCLEGG